MISLSTLFGFSIFLAGIAALFRVQWKGNPYLPFILCIWVGCINEILSYILWSLGYHTSLNNNLYVLAEAILYLLFFQKMEILGNDKTFFRILIASVMLVWIIENLVLARIHTISSVFRFYYSLIILLLATTLLSRMLVMDNFFFKHYYDENIYKNAAFWIGIGAIVFFLFKLQIEIFWYYGLRHSAAFRIKIYNILMYVNLCTNLIYTLAILWMPRKYQFTME